MMLRDYGFRQLLPTEQIRPAVSQMCDLESPYQLPVCKHELRMRYGYIPLVGKVERKNIIRI